MKRLEMFIPEEGDELIVIEELKEHGLKIGDIVIFENTSYLGAICRKFYDNTRIVVPFEHLNAIYKDTLVSLRFE